MVPKLGIRTKTLSEVAPGPDVLPDQILKLMGGSAASE